MEESSVLLSYFPSNVEATEAFNRLRRAAVWKTVQIQSSANGRVSVAGRAERTIRWRWSFAFLLVGLVISLVGQLLLNSFKLGWQQALVSLGFSVAFGFLGWLIARIRYPGVSSGFIDKYARWLVNEESLILIEGSTRSLESLVPILEGEGDVSPTAFIIPPALDQRGSVELPISVPLPSGELRRHAIQMTEQHVVDLSDGKREPLLERLDRAEAVIHDVCNNLLRANSSGSTPSPSEEWLLDNAYVIDGHIYDVRTNLPKDYYHELPVLVTQDAATTDDDFPLRPLRGEPRVYGIAAELLLHTDGRLERGQVEQFLADYQLAFPLTIGELWAVPLMFRVAVIDRLARLAIKVERRAHERILADVWANRLLQITRRSPEQLFAVLADLSTEQSDPSEYFASQLVSHLFDEESALVPVRSWLERNFRAPLGELSVQEQNRQAVEQVSIANLITSLRTLTVIDWREVFEQQSHVELTLRNDPAAVYAHMDFDTRDRYRGEVEVIAKSSKLSELQVVEALISLASQASVSASADPRRSHVGFYLVDEGRKELIQAIQGVDSRHHRRLAWINRNGAELYVSSILALSALLAGGIGLIFARFGGFSPIWLAGLVLLALLPVSQLCIQIVNYLFTRVLPPRTLPRMSFEKSGIPDAFRTLIVVPILMSNEQDLEEELHKLEIRFLANRESNLLFSLFTDFPDADEPHRAEDDDLIKIAARGIERLNEQYGQNRFYLFHRDREWCESEGKYIGWERKRGKLEELNCLIAGESSQRDQDITLVGDPDRLVDIRFVITLDSDTQLPRGTARKMIETLAHPLNQRQQIDGKEYGFTIVQPRVSTALPSAQATNFTRIFTDPVGTDPYTKAVSDVYQDLTGEASYHGKGLYDPRAFYRILDGRFPDETLLSHDLIEGAYVRVGLTSEVELFDDFPPDYQTYTRRQHRWIRGDWQIMDWVLPKVPSKQGTRVQNPLSLINRWKIFDNLRRSLVPVGSVAFLFAVWASSPVTAALGSLLILLLQFFQPLTQPLTWATSSSKIRTLSWSNFQHDLGRAVIELSLLLHQAGLALDAILRVFYRRFVSKKRLLEWTTAQMPTWSSSTQNRGFLLSMSVASLISLGILLAVYLIAPTNLPMAMIFLALWFISPGVGSWLNREPQAVDLAQVVGPHDRGTLRLIARKTWRYFTDFVNEDTHWLPPDNYQVSHQNRLALRTSPTNIGLWMLSALGAHDLGFLTLPEVIRRISNSLQTLRSLERFEGHFLNWYSLEDLRPLEPRYVSMVDSGNLLASLWALRAGLGQAFNEPMLQRGFLTDLSSIVTLISEVTETEQLSKEQQDLLADIESLFQKSGETLIDECRALREIATPSKALADSLQAEVDPPEETAYWSRQLWNETRNWLELVDGYLPWLESEDESCWMVEEILSEGPSGKLPSSSDRAPSVTQLDYLHTVDITSTLEQARSTHPEIADPAQWTEMVEQLARSGQAANELVASVNYLMEQIDEFSAEMSMRFLYDEERRLFRIGYNASAHAFDNSYYDLLASEARLGSFVAIASGEVPLDHWLALNRPYGAAGNKRVLLSWSGTMFEYLMPALLQRSYPNSLLDNALRGAVLAQIEYGKQRKVPWGISESAYADLDVNKTYQYQAFGVPSLGLKRGLDEDLVVAPYATLLALSVSPELAVKNLDHLDQYEMSAEYGFYEAIDFSRRRQREGERGVHVRAYMAHHQAMGFLAIVNFLVGNAMQARFHSDPRVQATEPLLYERIPVSPPLYHVSAESRPVSREVVDTIAPSVSKFDSPHSPSPKTQLLSNGRYNLMITSAGGGYSQWNDMMLTRWRPDPTQDAWGSFCYIHDVDNEKTWSTAFHPVGDPGDEYNVHFTLDRAEFARLDRNIETETEIIVSPEDDVEIRRVTLFNRSLRARRIEITSYFELALASLAADRQHPAFNKLFIQTVAHPEEGSLIAFRRTKEPSEPQCVVGHRITIDRPDLGVMQFETDRQKFIGRGNTLKDPAALTGKLTGSEGYVLDPILSIRHELTMKPNERIQFSLILAADETQEGVRNLLAKYSEPMVIERALELAWARAQLELRTLRIQADEARRFQKLASYMIYPNARFRPPAERLLQNRQGQSALWAYGISGDLPIVLVTIDEPQDLGLVRQMLQAHSYWKQHGLKADLVILNEESSGYDQPLFEQLSKLIEAHSLYSGLERPGDVYLLTVDQIPSEDVTLLLATSNVALVAARGPLPQQLSKPAEVVELPPELESERGRDEPSAPLPFLELPYFNSIGGFTEDGKEYAIYLAPNIHTPMPWVNVMANPEFGAVVSESGSGYIFSGNSQRNRLTPWSNDPVLDPPSDVIYIRDEETGVFWTPTARPIREFEAYRARHGTGYTVFEHNSHAIEQELVKFVPMNDSGGDPVIVQRLRLKNDSSRVKRLSVTFYLDWLLGEHRDSAAMHTSTRWDPDLRAILAQNPYHPDYPQRVSFVWMDPGASKYSADRTIFIGRNQDLSNPAAMSREILSGRTGAGLDSCAALRAYFELEPDAIAEVVCVVGQVDQYEEIPPLIAKYHESLGVDDSLRATTGWWDETLGTLQVQTPELGFDYLINRWLLYQSLSSRVWGRTGFYQSGGAFGFRDQLQDIMALVYTRPEIARAQVLRAASRQFPEGDVQHWWHAPGGAGIRSRISDDLLWLPLATAHYITVTGDIGILTESLPFLEARELEPDEHEAYLTPETSMARASLYEHCMRAIERGLTRGPHGLPLIGSGDWNDGMNRVGIGGRGESVWLAWFLIEVLNQFAKVSERFERDDDAQRLRKEAQRLASTIEAEAWDGSWYRRGYFDDGTPLGSAANEEARIDSLPQSWAQITRAADEKRVSQALEAAWSHLVRTDEALVLLFTPPFDQSDLDPGYIKGYPPGVRENGGQYTHAALWLAMAFARSGDGDRAIEMMRILNPIEHTRGPQDLQRYGVEPYVVPADVYRLPGRIGQGGWTWYTGSSAWMYRVWLEEILGIKLMGDQLQIDPVIPRDWDQVQLTLRRGQAVYEVTIENPDGVQSGVRKIELDGRTVRTDGIQLEETLIKHRVRVVMG